MIVEKVISWITLISGLSISLVAIFYSVSGLISIFPTAIVPITIMGIVLEVGKLVATVWLKRYWSISPTSIKSYLVTAIMILMLITSLGIFGYLSRTHLDQSIPTSDISDKLEIIDSKIQTKQSDLESEKRSLLQLNTAVDQVLERTTTDKGVSKSIKIRQSQQAERDSIKIEIEKLQNDISILKEERAPYAQQLKKSQVEFGPITYIAALIYDNPQDENNLEKAVRCVIILLVIVFDPLAVTLLLASQHSFKWISTKTDATRYHELNDKLNDEHDEGELHKVTPEVENTTEIEENEGPILGQYNEKTAKSNWKAENQNDTLKRQEKLHSLGLIDNLPWEN